MGSEGSSVLKDKCHCQIGNSSRRGGQVEYIKKTPYTLRPMPLTSPLTLAYRFVLLERFPLVTNSARIVKEMNFRYVFNRGKKIVTSLDKINHVRGGQALFYQCTW